MTETLVNAETQPAGLSATLERWLESPPPSLSEALAETGVSVEALEDHARSGISAEELGLLHRLLVTGASSGKKEDADLLARLLPLLDPRERAWDRVVRAKNTGEVISATVTEAVKGGLVVDLGIRGFVPSSQIGLSAPRGNLNQYLGQTLRLRVMEVDRKKHTVILTNRQVMEEERAAKRKSALSKLEENEVRKGTVRRLTDIGAFVDVGGVDGLLHVSEISWKRVEHPSDVLKVGQKVQVKVLRVDPDAGRVSLSMRALMTDPWEDARRKYAIGTNLKVKISSIVPQGAVVELEEALEGFIPVSELANKRVQTPEEVVTVGQEVDAIVIDLRPREHRIVFSLRKLEQKRDRQVVESYQRTKPSRSDRTTLGDLFGHLFEEWQGNEEEEAAAKAAADAAAAAETGEATAAAPDETAVAASEETAAVETVEAPEAETAEPVAEAPAEEVAVAETEAPAADTEVEADEKPTD